MRDFLLVGAGGFLGAAARYGVNRLFDGSGGDARFPVATLIVNVSGCFAIGVLAGLSDRTALFAPPTRLFLMTGLLGGYTTFSAFALETVALGRSPSWLLAALNVVAQVGLGVLAVNIGYRIAGVAAA